VAPIGRLDKASEALLLLRQPMPSGRHGYWARPRTLKRPITSRLRVADSKWLEALARGVKRHDGELLRVQKGKANCVGGERNSWLEIVWMKAGTAIFPYARWLWS